MADRPYGVGVDAARLVRAMPGTLVAVGAALELRRFALYALALVGVAVGAGVIDCNPGWAFVAGGALALVVGGGLLARFVRRYPVAAPELRPEAR